MARVACSACGFDERVDWDGECRCPSCGSLDVRVALAVEEIPLEDFERMLGFLDDGDGNIAAAT